MKVLITGSRDFSNTDVVIDFISLLPLNVTIVHGDCQTGADMLANACAEMLGIADVRRYTAKWELFGKKAGVLRNQEMLDKEYVHDEPIDACLFFCEKPLKDSHGTFDMVKRVEKACIATVDATNTEISAWKNIINKCTMNAT